MRTGLWFAAIGMYMFSVVGYAQNAPDLRVGASFHAFDHLHAFGHQAEAAAACGVTIIYASGLGGDGYSGLPPSDEWAKRQKAEAEYAKHAKELGIPTVLGYLCSTSIVGLETFAKNWTPEQRAEFRSTPDTWLQLDVNGKPLASWYGGEYQPACMNNPDWRSYEKYMVRVQLETGHDGIFFDNPTVHKNGCYCVHCMQGFASYLREQGEVPEDGSVEALRKLAQDHSTEFKRYRCTIARDFFKEIRDYARTINPNAVITANNSLNSPSVFYSQNRGFAYNIHEMSKTEDFVVIEDTGTQPRIMPDGKTIEYGPTYTLLQSIVHNKPVVAVTIAEGDYHTPAHLVQLAMAEAAAHKASYMLWSTWPDDVRPGMISAVRPYADWLKSHTDLLNASVPRRDVCLYLPFQRWIETDECVALRLAAEMRAANIQFEVLSEDDFTEQRAGESRVTLIESKEVAAEPASNVLRALEAAGKPVVTAESATWLDSVRKAIGTPSLTMTGPATVRAVARDTSTVSVVHLYNLNVQRKSSFEDFVTPAENLVVSVYVPFPSVKEVRFSSADAETPSSSIEFTSTASGTGSRVDVAIPKLVVAAMLVIESGA
ncbi:MAG: hypothetical protein K1Y02_09805 [Candidatus Hydrogenedentes bacterium]|nr:hypothetical protein [Candidatus Hydrogenedentota bacterium]